MSQFSKFGPRFSGGRRKAERAEVIHDGGAHRDSNLSTPELTGTPLISFQPLRCICGGLVRTFKSDAATLHPESLPGAYVSMNFPGKLPSILLLVLLAAQGKRPRSGPHADSGAALRLGWNYSSCLLLTTPRAAALTAQHG